MRNTVRWGLLSTANINRRVIPAIRASDRGELAAVASRSQARAQAYASQWQIPQAFGSYQSMLDSDAVDAVYISLPNHLHAEWSIRALRAGKHVLCEKPLTISLEEMDRMVRAAEETKLALAEAFMYRHHPQTRIVGEWVGSGRLGQITLVRSVFNFSIHDRSNVRLVPEWGGGSLWDVGVYPLSLAQFIMGEPPEWVVGDQWLGSSGVDEVFSGQLHYSGGRVAQITSSFYTPFYTYAEILGAAGRLALNRPFVGMDQERKLIFYPANGEPAEILVPDKELYLGEIEDMHAAILDGQPTYLTLAESRNHVRTALALYESAEQRQLVHLEG
ncbi:MAG: Gfo/Idh/MocA family oxidoreductase [Chloroflexi bacterium]|nr:Gfo/Idh/MocA family oxidoreductase [Chloroflexota bacterium]MCI0575113.1 Gfo/Idh/MocA family oxidoreductase [Chloroflexota bacterium]MCI0646262.1 Gfo/Idh/MocA family oxidoreductase [Chloroflexota bacterium]MCI0728607.1 Gfo/Idh/MocA family oxidoreductase [Chloroflexota bacterium]